MPATNSIEDWLRWVGIERRKDRTFDIPSVWIDSKEKEGDSLEGRPILGHRSSPDNARPAAFTRDGGLPQQGSCAHEWIELRNGGYVCNFCGARSPSADRILTVKEVAAYLRVHPSTVYKLLREKKIPAWKIGSDWRFNLSLIDKWRMKQ